MLVDASWPCWMPLCLTCVVAVEQQLAALLPGRSKAADSAHLAPSASEGRSVALKAEKSVGLWGHSWQGSVR